MIDFNIVILGNEDFDNYDYFKINLDRVFKDLKIRKDNKIIFPKIYIGNIEYNIDRFVKKYCEENEYCLDILEVNTKLYEDKSRDKLDRMIISKLLPKRYSRGILIIFYDGKNKRNVEIYQKAMEFSIKIKLINIGSIIV